VIQSAKNFWAHFKLSPVRGDTNRGGRRELCPHNPLKATI